MAIEVGFVNLHGNVVTAEEAERYVALDDRVLYDDAVEAGYCIYREPFGMVVDMDRDRYQNTVLPGEDRAVREGLWCP
jgi:hypothetical protein